MTQAKKVELNKDELPVGWEASTLGKIASYIQRGKSPKYTEFSELPVVNQKCVRWHGIERKHVKYIHPDQFEKWEEKRFLQNGDLLWNSTGTGTIGRAAIVHLKEGEKLVADSHVTIVRSGEGMEPKYVHYWVMGPAVQNSIEAMQSGSTNQVELSKGAVESTPIPVAPPEQQKRIVAKIEELFSYIDAGIEALKKTKQLLKQYRQSVLKAAVTGELTKEWRESNKDKLEPATQLLERILKERRQKWEVQQLEQFKAKGKMPKNDKWKEKYKEPVATREWSFLCEIPDSWLWASVAQIGDSQDQAVLTGPFGSNLGKNDFTQEGVPILTIGCLQESGIDLNRAMHVSKKKSEELERYQLKEGDMLFSRMAAVGRAGFVTEELEGALFNYHIMRLRLHPHAMLQEYFVSYVRGSSQVYDYVKEVNHGATRDGINTQQLLEMPVALAPLQEQKEICKVVGEKLNAIRRLESDIDIQQLKAERNKQSVLVSAFSGLFER